MKDRKGQIVFLHGLTSAGKTSLCRELTARGKYAFFVLGFDLAEETVPEGHRN